MTSDAASIAWYLHRASPSSAIEWPEGTQADSPPDYPTRLPTSDLARLFEQAGQGNPAAATRAGIEAGRKPVTALPLLVRASARAADAADAASQFWSAFSGSTRLESRTEGDRWELVLVESWRERSRGQDMFLQYLVGSLVGALAEHSAGAVQPREVRLPGASQPGDGEVSRALGVPVHRGSDLTRIVYDRSARDVALRTSDPLVATFLSAELHRAIARLRLAVTWQIDELIRENLSEGLGMREAAKHLGLSERTLRRRLDEEGTSFRERLDHVRRGRALELLSDHDVQTVARQLGFVDARSFQRAFRRWTKMTPLEHKRRLRASARQAPMVARAHMEAAQ
ncbi:MAG: AraC family transcriptional regulator [Sandaracinaceae bacterium]